jgi:hypothetical protein
MDVRNDGAWLVSLVAVLLLVGCGADAGSSNGWDVDDRCEACSEADAGGDDGDIGAGGDGGDVEEPVEPLPDEVCTPRATSWNDRNVPPLPEPELDEECSEVEQRYDENGDGEVTLIYTWRRDGDSLVWQAQRSGEVIERIEHTYGAADQLIGATHHRKFTHIEGGYIDRTWTFDQEGRLLDYQAVGQPAELIEHDVVAVMQRWDDDRLVERTTTEYDGRRFTTAWSYEEQRLSRVELSSSDESLTVLVDWTYVDGLPVQVVRTVNDIEVMNQTWQWSQDGQLDGRSGLYDPRGHLTDPNGWRDGSQPIYPGGLDDFEPKPPSMAPSSTWNAWSGARWTRRDGCAVPPHSSAHGYPVFEPEYDLGFAIDERPNGIGFAYGNDTFGWDYGDKAWYGHGGIARAYGQLPDLVPFTFDITYDDERRMVAEHLEITRSRHEQPDHVESVDRVRTFDARGMVSDTVTIEAPAAETRIYAMHFERGPQGQLLERTLLEGEETLGHQTWAWDAGRIASHEVSIRQRSQDGTEALEPTARYIREYDSDGRIVRYADLSFTPDATWDGLDEERSYDERGRLTERRYDNPTRPASSYRHEFRYDGPHPTPVFEGTDIGVDGDLEAITTRRLGDDGQVRYEAVERNGHLREVSTSSYVCE